MSLYAPEKRFLGLLILQPYLRSVAFDDPAAETEFKRSFKWHVMVFEQVSLVRVTHFFCSSREREAVS